MRLDDISFKHVRRHKKRVVFPFLGVLLAITTVVGLLTISQEATRALADTFDEIGANIMIVPSDGAGLSYGGVTIPGIGEEVQYLHTNDVIKVNTIAERDSIAFVAPKVLAATQIKGRDVLLVGVDFPQELQMKRWWRYYGERPTGVLDVLLGHRAAVALGVKPGETIEIAEEQFTVSAVLTEQGTEEDDFVFMQLLTVQDIFNLDNKLSFIEVAAYCTTCPIDQIVGQISDVLPHARVTALAEAVKSREALVERFFSFTLIAALVLTVMAAFTVFITMMSAVKERTREIGILTALGYRSRHIFEIILTEVALVGLAGGFGGYVLGVFAAHQLAPLLLEFPIRVSFNPIVGYTSVLGAILLAVVAGGYPAYKAAGIDPADALRHV